MKASRRWSSFALSSLLLAAAVAPASAATPPAVPPNLEIPSGHRLTLMAHAVGTQNYTCTIDRTDPNAPKIGWVLYGPQATLFTDGGSQVTTHYLSPNPDENGTPRATWHHSRDSSTVWAKAVETSADPAYVDPNAIPWLRLEVVGAEAGPKRGTRIAWTRYIQRVNTVGGKPPATGCATDADLGKKQLVPYEADYVFYRTIRNGPVV